MSELFRKLAAPFRGGVIAKSPFKKTDVIRAETSIPVEQIASEFGGSDEVEITETRAHFIPRHQKRKLAAGALLGLGLGLFLASRRKKRPA